MNKIASLRQKDKPTVIVEIIEEEKWFDDAICDIREGYLVKDVNSDHMYMFSARFGKRALSFGDAFINEVSDFY